MLRELTLPKVLYSILSASRLFLSFVSAYHVSNQPHIYDGSNLKSPLVWLWKIFNDTLKKCNKVPFFPARLWSHGHTSCLLDHLEFLIFRQPRRGHFTGYDDTIIFNERSPLFSPLTDRSVGIFGKSVRFSVRAYMVRTWGHHVLTHRRHWRK